MTARTAAAPLAGDAAAETTGRRAPSIVADAAEGVDLAVVHEALDRAVAVVVTTTSRTGIERTRRTVFMSPEGASHAVDKALARGHRVTAVLVRLVVLGEAL
ncbi:hypothetical protein [Kineococcus arenarius]|uniref:hypothetical protein n=1 Tax=unclassified Kineococcus TaxID=2621656 RepID=UPI003D7C97ED